MSGQEPLVAGVELGGTKAVVVLARGVEVFERHTIPTTSPEETLGQANAQLQHWMDERRFAALGIAAFGPLDLDPASPGFGRLFTTPKPGWANFDVAGALTSGLACPWAIEAGWKSSFLDNHVRTQVGAFYMSYKDFQIDSVEPTTGQGGVHNVSNATIKGVELQVQAKLGGFGFDGGLAYVDSKLDKFQFINQRLLPGTNLGPQCTAGVTPSACFDYGPFTTIAGGGPNLYSPKWSYNFGVQYQAEIAPDMTLTPRLNYAYIGARWTNLLLNPVTDYLPGRGLLSALLTLQKGEWTIEGYGTNLTNKKYVSGQFINDEFYGAPREYGVRASVRF
ncbi:MAG: TonB-dependent receptor domain-containing protein [Croceibacterium sp.]